MNILKTSILIPTVAIAVGFSFLASAGENTPVTTAPTSEENSPVTSVKSTDESSAVTTDSSSSDDQAAGTAPAAAAADTATGAKDTSRTESASPSNNPAVTVAKPDSADQQKTAAPITGPQFAKVAVVSELHHLNQMQLKLASLASEKSQSANVKSVADQITKAHEKADSDLASYSKDSKIDLADFKANDHEQAILDGFQSLQPTDFDRAFEDFQKKNLKELANRLMVLSTDERDQKMRSVIVQTTATIRKDQASNLSLNPKILK